MAFSSSDSGYVDNWQTGKTVTECNLHMLTTSDCSDIIFHVGSEKHVVRAHRYVLVSRSCVFHAMFCGPLAEKGEVTIPDIEPQVFKDFLRYMYTDIVTINADNATGLLYTSRKYAVDGLMNQCVTFLDKSLSEENVCEILEQCHGYGEEDLEKKALKILTEAGDKVVKSKGFLNLCSGCIGKFLKSDILKLKEEDVFQATLSWAKEKCEKANVGSSNENLRKFLGDMVYEIRFTSLPLDYLVRVVGPSRMLTAEERMNIVDRSVKSDTETGPFNSSPRRNCLPVRYVSRFTQGFAAIGNGLPGSDRRDIISFSINRNIQLVGCQLYGSVKMPESDYSLNIVMYDDQNRVIAEPVPQSDMRLQGQNELNDVMFPYPVTLLAGRYYTLTVNMSGENINFGEGGQSQVEEDCVKFSFCNSPIYEHSNFTTTEGGQIPGLMWR